MTSLSTDPKLYGKVDGKCVDVAKIYSSEVVDCCSEYGKDNFAYGDKSLQRYYKPACDPVRFDLRKDFTKLDGRNGVVKGEIKALKLSNSEKNAEFLCPRFLLLEVSLLPYFPSSSFEFFVIRYRGIYYMFDIEKSEPSASYPEMEKNIFMTRKFEQYMTENKDGGQSFEEGDLNQAFHTIVESRLTGKHKKYHHLLMINEADCLSRESGRFIELKTSKRANLEKTKFYDIKLRRAWVESFLVGVEKVVYGFYNDQDVIDDVQDYLVSEIPQKASRKLRELNPSWDPIWEPSVCLTFASAFLDFVKTNITQDEAVCVFKCPLKGFVTLNHMTKEDPRYKSLLEIVKAE